MPAGPCHYCKEPIAPFQYRPPGLFTQLPAAQRGKYIRACANPECRAKAEARIREVSGNAALTIAAAPDQAPAKPRRKSKPKPQPEDGLFAKD